MCGANQSNVIVETMKFFFSFFGLMNYWELKKKNRVGWLQRGEF